MNELIQELLQIQYLIQNEENDEAISLLSEIITTLEIKEVIEA